MCNFEAIEGFANYWYNTAINTLEGIEKKATTTCVKTLSSFIDETTANKIVALIKRVLIALPTTLCLTLLPATHAYLLIPVYLIAASQLGNFNVPIGDGFGLYLGASAIYHLSLCVFNPSIIHISAAALLGMQAAIASTIWDG